jgi:hypothetical protein
LEKSRGNKSSDNSKAQGNLVLDQFKLTTKKKRFGKREAFQKNLSQFRFTLR